MKAIVYHKSGSSEVLKCEEIEKPRSNDGEVPIRVRAASYDSVRLWRMTENRHNQSRRSFRHTRDSGNAQIRTQLKPPAVGFLTWRRSLKKFQVSSFKFQVLG